MGPMAAMFGVIAAVAELPRSFRHIDSTDAKSTFRTLASTMPMHVAIEWAGVMPGSNERRHRPWGEPRSTRITTSSCTFYKLDKCLTAEEPEVFLIRAGRALLRGSHLALTNSSSVKPSSRILRFPPATPPQALDRPAAAAAVTEGQTFGRYSETGYIDEPRASRASAEDELRRVPGRRDVQPGRCMRRYRAWPDSSRSIVACT